MEKKQLSLKVYIDTSPLGGGHAVRGVGAYTRNLAEELKRKKEVNLVDLIKDADVIHYPYFDLFFNTLPLRKVKPTLVTIHDVIPLLYPKHYPPGIKGELRFLKQKQALKSVSAVITDSEVSKKDIVRFLGIPQEKIHVIHLAPGEIFKKLPPQSAGSRFAGKIGSPVGGWKIEIQKKYGLPNKFVLYVGDVNYNKNVLNLATACKLIKMPLVIIGKQAAKRDFDHTHPENQPLVQLIEIFGRDSKVLRIGFVPDEELVRIYNLATVYCQPSFYEGFGLPVLEAMACGTPVVAAKISTLIEIAEGVAHFVNPNDSKDIAHGLSEVITKSELSDELIKKGLEHVKKFSWSLTADETIKIYKGVVK